MKSISIKLFGAAVLLAAALTASAQNSETRKVSNFNGVATGGSFIVHIKIDGQESLKLTGPAEVLKEIESTVEDGTLHVKFKDGYYRERQSSDEKIVVDISAKELSSLSASGSNKVDVEGKLTGQHVHVSTSGAGTITTGIKATDFDCSISGSGEMNLSGGTVNSKFSISGAGKMNAYDLKSENTQINIAGSGTAYVFADKTISAHMAGAGHVVYRGNGSINDVHSAGNSSITKDKGE